MGVSGIATRRVGSLDTVRGLCLVSMLVGHFAEETAISRAVHGARWIDGAVGFVLVSGLVLGLVRRRAFERGATIRDLTHASWNRAAQLWALAMLLSGLGLALEALFGSSSIVVSYDDLGGAGAIVDLATLQTSLNYVDILALYVWLLLLTPVVLLLLARSQTALALAIVPLPWLIDLVVPIEPFRTLTADSRSGEVVFEVLFVAPRWFVLFGLGLVGGWHWAAVRAVLAKRAVQIGLAGSTLAFLVAARVVEVGDSSSVPTWLVDREELGLLTLVFALVAIGLMVVLLEVAGEPFRRLIEPVTSIGRISLWTYGFHVIVLFVFDVPLSLPFSAPVGLFLALLTFVVAWAWSVWGTPGLVRSRLTPIAAARSRS
jgi:hypothetical protein